MRGCPSVGLSEVWSTRESDSLRGLMHGPESVVARMQCVCVGVCVLGAWDTQACVSAAAVQKCMNDTAEVGMHACPFRRVYKSSNT